MKYIIVYGNVFDGLAFIGPFETVQEAATHVMTDADIDTDWNIADLESPCQST